MSGSSASSGRRARPITLAEHALKAGTLPKLEAHVGASAVAKKMWKAWGERPNLKGEDRGLVRLLALDAERDAEDTWDEFANATPGISSDEGRIKVRKVPRKMLAKAQRVANKSVHRALRPLGNRGKRKTLRSWLRSRRGSSRRRRSVTPRTSSRGGARTRRRR